MASENWCFHLPKTLFSSLQLKLYDIAQRLAQKDAKHKKLLNLLCIIYFLELKNTTHHTLSHYCSMADAFSLIFATLTYKALNGITPEYITNMLTPNSQVHDRTLRSSVDGTLMVPRSRTSLNDKSFSVSVPKY